MSGKEDDLAKIKELIKVMDENNLTEIEIKHGDDRILLKRGGAGQPILSVPPAGVNIQGSPVEAPGGSLPGEPGQAIPSDEGLEEIKSPIVGTFYAQPSPDSEPFVEEGSTVSSQSVVCIIEAMKVMNEIKAEISGTITEVLVSSGQAVEYGQPLFKIKPE